MRQKRGLKYCRTWLGHYFTNNRKKLNEKGICIIKVNWSGIDLRISRFFKQVSLLERIIAHLCASWQKCPVFKTAYKYPANFHILDIQLPKYRGKYLSGCTNCFWSLLFWHFIKIVFLLCTSGCCWQKQNPCADGYRPKVTGEIFFFDRMFWQSHAM